MKPRFPIFAGFFPVAKHCQAGTLDGGTIDSRTPWTPRWERRLRLGSLSIHFSIRCGEAASRPITIALMFSHLVSIFSRGRPGRMRLLCREECYSKQPQEDCQC